MCRPTPDSGASDLVLRLKLSCVSSYRPCSETSAPDLLMPAVSEYQLSGPRLSLLALITRGRTSLPPPSVSSHALSLLISQAPTGSRITFQTRSPGSVTLGCLTLKNANKLADTIDTIVSNPRQLCWITTFYQLMFMTLEDA